MASIKLSIDEPCHENWNAMLPEDKGRFCLSCQKTVVDFTAMNDRQVFDYFKEYNGNTCGQFSNDQLNRELTKPKTHSIGRWKYFWQILLPAVFAFHKADAQTKLRGKVAATQTCKVEKEKPVTITMGMVAPQQKVKPAVATAKIIEGKIVNSKKEPLPFTSIVSSDGKYATANADGKFKIVLSDKATLIISQVGYQEKKFTVDSIQTEKLSALKFENGNIIIETTIELKQDENLMGDVVVVGYGRTTCRTITGSVSRINVNSLLGDTLFRIQKTFSPANIESNIKIFPNPIQPGQDFQITFNITKPGNYLLKITDASGRIIAVQKIKMLAKTQTETISGNGLQQAGIYFVTLTNPADKKGNILNGRVIVQ